MSGKREREKYKKEEKHLKIEVKDGGKDKEKPLEKMTKSELLEKIEQLREESQKNYDLFLRSQADIENIKKRNAKDKEQWVKYANETLVKEILPVMDNLEKALSHANDENSLNALKEGVELTLKGLKDTLVKAGLEEVKAQGECFDPNYHHAVSELEHEDVESGTILEQFQKGYTFNQRLIRPAMVVVSKGKPNESTNQGDSPDGES